MSVLSAVFHVNMTLIRSLPACLVSFFTKLSLLLPAFTLPGQEGSGLPTTLAIVITSRMPANPDVARPVHPEGRVCGHLGRLLTLISGQVFTVALMF